MSKEELELYIICVNRNIWLSCLWKYYFLIAVWHGTPWLIKVLQSNKSLIGQQKLLRGHNKHGFVFYSYKTKILETKFHWMCSKFFVKAFIKLIEPRISSFTSFLIS